MRKLGRLKDPRQLIEGSIEGIYEGIASSEKIDGWSIKVSQGIVLRECTLFKC